MTASGFPTLVARAAALRLCLVLASSPSIAEDVASYVGASACVGCHAEEARSWTSSHHAKAMQAATPLSVLGDFSGVEFTHPSGVTRFDRKGDKFVVKTDGSDGKVHDYEISYTFGVSPLQQYLVPAPGGRYQALGVAWDSRPKSQGGQRWFHLYPDRQLNAGERLHWTGRDQTWNFMCAACHSTDVQKSYDLADDSYATRWSDVNVGCEACHGAGSKHVAAAKPFDPTRSQMQFYASKSTLPVALDRTSASDWHMNFDTGIAQRTAQPTDHQLDSCFPCHSRRKPITNVRPPGATFLDHYLPALLEPSLYHSDGQIDGEVFEYGSFLQSAMYRAGVRCTDCHDPHSLTLRAQGNALCGQCHLPAKFDTSAHHHHQLDSKEALCVSCHMTTKTYMVVDERRDHSFRVPRPDLSASLGTPNACTSCHTGEAADWAAGKIADWYPDSRNRPPHFAAALDAGRKGSVDAERRLSDLVLDRSQPEIARASALALLPPFATTLSEPAVRSAFVDPSPLVRMAAARALGPSPPLALARAALPLLHDPVRAVRIETARALTAVDPQGLDDDQRKDFAEAYLELAAAEMVDADRPEAHLNLGLSEARQGRAEAARGHYETALRLDPKFVPALVNLADLARGRDKEGEAETMLHRAAELEPDNADVHHSLGLLLIRQKNYSDALVALRKAHELAPDNPRYAYVYAIALDSTGAREQAWELLESTQSRHPADREVLSALVSLARRNGDLANALTYAKRLEALLPTNFGVRNLVRDLEGRLAH